MSEIAQAIGRVRRAMPRNSDVMLICDECDRLVRTAGESLPALGTVVPSKPVLSRAEIQKNYRLREKAKK